MIQKVDAIIEDGGLPQTRVPKIGAASLYLNLAEFQSHIHNGALLKLFFMKITHVALEKPSYCMVYDDAIVNCAKPQVLPKVKKEDFSYDVHHYPYR